MGDEALQLGEVLLGLPGEADDEVRAGTRLRGLAADGAEQFQELVGVAEAPHPAQYGGRRVLERQVEVRQDSGGTGHHVDQAGPHLGGLQVADPHPLDAGHRRDLAEQRLQQADVAEVLAVRGVVLADQDDLADALPGQPDGLVEHVRGAARDERAAEGGDRAEGTAAVAARGELDGGHRVVVQPLAQGARPGGGGEAVGEVGGDVLGGAVTRQGDLGGGGLPLDRGQREELAAVPREVRGVVAAGEDRLQALGDVGVVVETEYRVGLGQRVGEFLAVALGHAADGDDGLRAAVTLEVVGLQEGVDGVLLGGFDEPAGVDDGDVGVGGVVDQLPAIGLQSPGEFLGVHLVAGASERDKGDSTAFRHRAKINARPPVPFAPEAARLGLADLRPAGSACLRVSGVYVTCTTWPSLPAGPRSLPLTYTCTAPALPITNLICLASVKVWS